MFEHRHRFDLYRAGLLALCLLPLTPVVAQDLTAAEIMARVAHPEDGESAIIDYTLVLIDRRERQRSRTLRVYRMDVGEDSRTLSLFDSPADIRGTAYLNYNYADTDLDNDSWLYLPSLQRVKRIASSDTADSFMGSDFTYADINGLEDSWFDFRFIDAEANVDGQPAWHIEAVPKAEYKTRAEASTGYTRMHFWVDKTSFLQLRGQYWELRGNRVKYFSASNIELVDGIWTPHRLQVITTRNDTQEHASVLQVNAITYNTSLAEDLFLTENLPRALD